MKNILITIIICAAVSAVAQTTSKDHYIPGPVPPSKATAKLIDPNPASPDNEYIEKTLYKATGLLYSQADDGSMKMRCTVTAIEKTEKGYLFVTAAHCTGHDNTEHERVDPDKTFFFITADAEGSKDFIKAKLIASGYQHESDDFSLFEADTDAKFELVPIGEDVANHAGEPILNIASPLGLGK